MQLSTSVLSIDYFPVAGGKRFVQRIVWNSGYDSGLKSFCTVSKTDALYDMNSRIAKGAEVTGFNTEAYAGTDYRPLYC